MHFFRPPLLAFDLGLDVNANGSLDDEAISFQTVAGVGGSVEIPVLRIDALSLRASGDVEFLFRDITVGARGTEIRSGIIGEIGVGSSFTPRERKSLAAACIAQVETHLPMQVHMPAWFRLGDEVLDVDILALSRAEAQKHPEIINGAMTSREWFEARDGQHLKTGERWTLRPNEGPLPWWVFAKDRRTPGARRSRRWGSSTRSSAPSR